MLAIEGMKAILARTIGATETIRLLKSAGTDYCRIS